MSDAVKPTLLRRYLDLLKASLLNELYIENEVRLLYIFAMANTSQPIDPDVVRNIARRLPDWVKHVQAARQEGGAWWAMDMDTGSKGAPSSMDLRNVCEFSHTMIGRRRLDNIEQCLDGVRLDNIPGDVIETGVWRGGASIFMRGYLAAYEMTGRKVWVADSFEGLPKPSYEQDQGYDMSVETTPILAVPIEEVKENFRRYGLLDDQVEFIKGWFKDTLRDAPVEQLALARLDGDLYESTMDALNALYHKLAVGGYIIIDDYGTLEPCRRAVDEFRAKFGIATPITAIDAPGAFWRKLNDVS